MSWKLDKVLTNVLYIGCYDDFEAEFFNPNITSDYSYIKVSSLRLVDKGRKSFSFFDFLYMEDGKGQSDVFFYYQIKLVKKELIARNKVRIINVGNRVERVRKELDIVQTALQSDRLSGELIHDEMITVGDIMRAKRTEESMRRQK